ncbi:MAG: xanthan lyase [Calditrichaeota bacterium]|nr:xanthan lyase [Calditrichota bacterium]
MFSLMLAACAFRPAAIPYKIDGLDGKTREAYRIVHGFLQEARAGKFPFEVHPNAGIDTILVDRDQRRVAVFLNPAFAFVPFREENTRQIRSELLARLAGTFKSYQIDLQADRIPLEQLIPNAYRSTTPVDSNRLAKLALGKPIVENLNRPFRPAKGLQGNHIALWHSHGWYYDYKQDRWKWQRARVFQIVEDMFPMAFTLPYLVPMLENAGARVFLPRERDLQNREVLIDNDHSDSLSYRELDLTTGKTRIPDSLAQVDPVGFGEGNPPYGNGENPFRLGTFRIFPTVPDSATLAVQWTPDFPESGEYAVHVAYGSHPGAVPDARYTVSHAGGETTFQVNQQMGAGTWIYLGTFTFPKGRNPERGRVSLSNHSQAGGVITPDAVRFGGGMGNVARNGRTSGRARYQEGARYYMQYAGMPDTLVYNVTEDPQDDYKDDYRGRGEWVNYLKGAPFGPNKDRSTKGLGIPIDLSLAFHTDAGMTGTERTIGTLMITSLDGADSTRLFPDGVSRLANRDFGDMLQTQIVGDIRRQFNPEWTRRSIWNKDYSESFRPNVPAALLELLSHHNYGDMIYGLDPTFRFQVSRSIYKAMLRFLAFSEGRDYKVQPLPVGHLTCQLRENRAVLRWRAVSDSLEPGADPTAYLVYTAKDSSGWDNGARVAESSFTSDVLDSGVVYRFRVSALNEGGESFPSETAAVVRGSDSLAQVLIVNGFDRVCGPARLEAGNLRGFMDQWDPGVADRREIAYVGSQLVFENQQKFLTNEQPGHGTSHADFETRIVPGNTFDFAVSHAAAIAAAGYSAVTVSDEAVASGWVDLRDYTMVDYLLGEEKTTILPGEANPRFAVFPDSMVKRLRDFCAAGGALLISGAYVGSEAFEGRDQDHPARRLAVDWLKYRWQAAYGARRGEVVCADTLGELPAGTTFTFNQGYREDLYAAEFVDAITAADSSARTVFRYAENQRGAGVLYNGDYRSVVLAFPLETVYGEAARRKLMAAILRFLDHGDPLQSP